MQQTKVCCDCGKQKPIEKFSFSGPYPFHYCKACNSERAKRAYHAMSPEERREANRRRRGASAAPEARRKKYAEDPEYRAKAIASAQAAYDRLRSELFAGYGGRCTCCGETELMFLELDHVNGGGAKEYRSIPPPTVYRRLIKEGFPPTYCLLCSNCNTGRHRNGGICPHKQRA